MYCSTASSCSGRKAEDLLYKGSLRPYVTPGHRTHLSLGEHRLDAGQRSLRGPEALKAKHGPGQAPQLALLLPLAQRAGIALEAIGHDLARVVGVLPAEGTLEEALCCLFVSLGTE